MNASWVKLLPGFIRARLESRHGLQAIIGNTGWLFADKILRMGAGLIVSVWIARYLGPEQYGLWNFAIAFAALFGAFAALGLDNVVVRELVKNPARQNELLGSAFALKLAASLCMLIMAIAAISIARSGETFTLWLVAISAAGYVFLSINVIDFYFQAKVQSKFTVIAVNGAFAIATVAKIALLLIEAPLIAFVWAGSVETALSAIFLLAAYRINRQDIRKWRFRAEVAVELLKDGWPLILSGLAIMIYMRIDQIMIGQMLGDKEVGLFSAAARISEVWYFIPVAVVSSVFPSVIAAKQLEEALYLRRLQRLYNLMVGISLAIAIPTTIFSGWIINLLFGANYIQAAGTLSIHIWGGIFVFLWVACGQWYLNENLQRIAFLMALLGILVKLGLNYVMIPAYGIEGAAMATVISLVVATYIFDFIHRKTRGMFWMKTRSIFFILDYKSWRNLC
ncbi:MAG: hypothetical protein A3F73_11840 [Gallionellales bacterium RIFCSPLOWO2_12_FULL_59_22]|nr:MAG: hypothetical protein A3H99_08770 [Gallionellales bacterium RIFCSPLOWO2_02_FULL_59_110]OGT04161.1 MAG: hypothetical protein A2Z65_05960 [Gallionellales bacterium RIFCSPLOWO2_02_58_13]OGT10133.1 MAG: hypothetical protein A3F73_11840 [Gallionellales bacterium RIFCSPLOWO2_12_FULL_59_22]